VFAFICYVSIQLEISATVVRSAPEHFVINHLFIKSLGGSPKVLAERYMRYAEGQELTTNLVLRRERGLHGRNVENNLQSNGESILESPEVHDRHIEATASALNGAVTSSDDRDTVAAIDNAFDGHMVL
jgi:hypothetical protein